MLSGKIAVSAEDSAFVALASTLEEMRLVDVFETLLEVLGERETNDTECVN